MFKKVITFTQYVNTARNNVYSRSKQIILSCYVIDEVMSAQNWQEVYFQCKYGVYFKRYTLPYDIHIKSKIFPCDNQNCFFQFQTPHHNKDDGYGNLIQYKIKVFE